MSMAEVSPFNLSVGLSCTQILAIAPSAHMMHSFCSRDCCLCTKHQSVKELRHAKHPCPDIEGTYHRLRTGWGNLTLANSARDYHVGIWHWSCLRSAWLICRKAWNMNSSYDSPCRSFASASRVSVSSGSISPTERNPCGSLRFKFPLRSELMRLTHRT